MIGSTKFTFELTATKTSNFAFVLQREGLEAQGLSEPSELGGAAGIRSDLVIVFDTRLEQVRIFTESGGANPVTKASMAGLGTATALPVEISVQDSLVSVSAQSRQYLSASLQRDSIQQSLKYFAGLTANLNDSSVAGSRQAVTLNYFKIAKAEPTQASMQILGQTTGEVLDVGIDARLNGQLRVTLADACGLTTSIMSYLPETQLGVRLQSPAGDSSTCTLTILPLLFSTETYQPAELSLEFSCDIVQVDAEIEVTELELVYDGQAGIALIMTDGTHLVNLSSSNGYTQVLSHVVVDGADLQTGQLKQIAYLENPYQLKVTALDTNYDPIETFSEELVISVTQASIQRIADSSAEEEGFFFTQEVALDCYLTQMGTPCADAFTVNKAADFSFVFSPTQTGSYTISSPYFATSSFYVIVVEAPEDFELSLTSTFLSTQFSYAEIQTDNQDELEMEAGQTFALQIHLMSALNAPIAYNLSSQCSIANSFYVISDGETQTRGTFESIDHDSLRLSTLVVKTGTLTAHPVVTCGSSSDSSVFYYEYPIRCAGLSSAKVCQRVVTPRALASVQLTIPRDYKTSQSLKESLALNSEITTDIEQMFLQGENLVFDLIAVDVFGNHVKDADLAGTTAKFVYGSQEYSLSSTTTLGVVHFIAESEQSNLVFKALPPRSDFYKVVTDSSQKELDNATIFVDILNLSDADYPSNISTDGDGTTLELGLSQIIFPNSAQVGSAIDIEVVLLSDQLLRVPALASEISASIYDIQWREGCKQSFANGLYPGHFIGQLLCSKQSLSSPDQLELIMVYQGRTPLTSENTVIEIDSQFPVNASAAFYAVNGTVFEVSDANRSIQISFGLIDRFINVLRSTQLSQLGSYGQSELLDATYTIINEDIGQETQKLLPLINESGICEIRFYTELTVGLHRLELQLSVQEKPTIWFEVTSIATDLSPFYSTSQLLRGDSDDADFAIGSSIQVAFTPRNKHNATLTSLDVVTQQVYCHVANDRNSWIELDKVSQLNETTFIFESESTVEQSGSYSSHLQIFNEAVESFVDSYTYVRDGLFEVSLDGLSILNQVQVLVQADSEWLELSKESHNFYSELIHGPVFVFKAQHPDNDFVDFSVSAIEFLDFSTMSKAWTMSDFTKIDEYTFAFSFPPETYGKQTFTLILTLVASDGQEDKFEWEILTTDRMDQNPQESQAKSNMIECPQFLTLTAGTVASFECFINEVSAMDLVLTSEALATYSTAVEQVSDSVVAVQLAKTAVTAGSSDLLFLTDQTTSSFTISVEIVPSSLQSMLMSPVDWQPVTSPHEVDKPFLVQMSLLDQYQNTIPPERTPYSEQQIVDLFAVTHDNPNAYPVDVQIELRERDFLVNITTQYEGSVTISSPLFGSREEYVIDFYSKLLPSEATSYAVVQQQEIVAGQSVTVKVYLRDIFGNKNLQVLQSYDPATSDSFKISIGQLNLGKGPVYTQLLEPVIEQDGSTTLVASLQLTAATYYHVRVQMFDVSDIACSGSIIKVLTETTPSFSAVRVQDFTQVLSTSGARLLRDEELSQLTLQFLDAHNNVIDRLDFTENVTVQIVDLYNESIVYSLNEAVLLPVAERPDLYTVDFCRTAVGLETPCLTTIAYGRLKIEDTAGSGKVFLPLKMIQGVLTDSNKRVSIDYEPLSAAQEALLDSMVENSVIADIEESDTQLPATLQLTELEDSGSYEIRISSLEEAQTFTVVLEEFDTASLKTIDLGIIELVQESSTSQVGSITLSKSGIYFFKAQWASMGIAVPCISQNCIAVVRDGMSGLIETRVLHNGVLRQGEVKTLLYDFTVVPEEQLTVQTKGSPANFEYETQAITVLGTDQVYVLILVTQAMPNTLVEIQLLSNLLPIASQTLLIESTAPLTVLVAELNGTLEITAQDSLGAQVRISPQQASTFLQIVDESQPETNLVYQTEQRGKYTVVLPITLSSEPLTFDIYTNVNWSIPQVITVQAEQGIGEIDLEIIDADGRIVEQDQLTAGLYQERDSQGDILRWLVVASTDHSYSTLATFFLNDGSEHSEGEVKVIKTVPFLIKLQRIDAAGITLDETDGTSFEVLVSSIELFEITKMPDGSAIASIDATRTYNSLSASTYEIVITTLLYDNHEVVTKDTYSLVIIEKDSDSGSQSSSKVESLSRTLTSVGVETVLGHSFSSILRQGIENQIIFKTLDQYGLLHDFQEVTVELATIKDEFSERVLTQLANDGAYVLSLVPSNVRQTGPEQLKVVFTTQTDQLEVSLDYTIQPAIPPVTVNPLFNNSTWLKEGRTEHKAYSRIELSFELAGSTEKTLLVNDTQIHKMLRVYRNSELFAGSSGALRQIEMSEVDLTTFSLPAYLGSYPAQIFDLYFIDETDLWHHLFSVTLAVEQVDDTPQQPLSLLSPAMKKRNRRVKQTNTEVSVQLLTNSKTNEVSIGLNTPITVLLVAEGETSCLVPTADFNYLTDLEMTFKVVSSGKVLQRPTKQQTSTSGYVCPKFVQTMVMVSDKTLVGEKVELKVAYKPTGASQSVTLTVIESPIDFSMVQVSWLDNEFSGVVAGIETSQVFTYKINFFNYAGETEDLPDTTPITVLFDESLDLSKVITSISESGLVTVLFSEPGTYFVKGYRISGQDLHPIVTSGPTLFQVTQAACPQLAVEPPEAHISSGDAISINIKCLDEAGFSLAKQPSPAQVRVQMTRTSTKSLASTQHLLQATSEDVSSETPVRVSVTQGANGGLQASQTLTSLGQYLISVVVNDQIVSQEYTVTVAADLCVANAAGDSEDIYLCPETSVCTSDYFNCPLIDEAVCTDPAVGLFKCPNISTEDLCVTNVMTDCCANTEEGLETYYCPYSQTCVPSEVDCCQLNPDTPIYCEETSQCVTHQYECCSNYVSASNPMIKCSFEDKCVPDNTDSFCFIPLQRDCSDSRFPYLCPNDGICRRNSAECPSPQVCPPGYTQCPDRTCVAGEAKFSDCKDGSESLFLTTCLTTLPYDTDPLVQVRYIRCPNGRTCVTDVDDCPTEISCMEEGSIVCPDSTCRKNAFECVQPPETPFDIVDRTSCGPQMMRCPNGQCSDECSFVDELTVQNCTKTGQVMCGRTLTCANTYQDCSVEVYCPNTQNFTLSPASFLCGDGPQVCVADRSMCQSTACSSSYAFWPTNTTVEWPYEDFDPEALHTCPDGRCIMNGACMTPFQCSSSYRKAGGFGLFCVLTESEAQFAHQTAIKLHALTCPPGTVMCLNGECRSTVYDCPQDTSCPSSQPIQCKDAQCATTSGTCSRVDNTVYANLYTCLDQNQILCSSDLVTCADSQELCPTLSTCPFGYLKCSETLCVNPLEGECPGSFTSCSDIITDSGLYCRDTQDCVSDYESCPTMVSCPQDRPVKCASDQSCRESVTLCPSTFSVTTLTSGGSNFVVCPSQTPVKCEDGSCRSSLKACNNSLPVSVTACLRSKNNYFCFLSGICVSSQAACQSLAQSMSPCPTGTLYNHTSQQCVAALTTSEETTCLLSGQFYCSEEQGCQDAPCDNWLTCPDGQYLCSTGQCVTDSATCTSSSNWCPFDKPVRCDWTADCVSSLDDCQGTQEALQTVCEETYTGVAEIPCAFEGNCKSTSSDCATELTQTCFDFLFPNTIKDTTEGMQESVCYIPSCPVEYPIKCDNGLCVDDSLFCPSVQSQISDTLRCSTLSDSTGKSLTVPCADGSCVQNPNQCLPIYSCALNPAATVRCNDGTCRETESDCPQLVQSCPAESPYRCLNGMCATDSDSCVQEDGCPVSLPYQCSYSGICMFDSTTCFSPFQLMGELSLIPSTSSKNLCEQQEQVACYSSSTLFYCVSTVADCILTSNQCPISAPIFCDNECRPLANDCQQLSQPTLLSFPLTDFTAKNNVNCPQSTPFRCSDLELDNCKALPYTSYNSLAGVACSTSSQALQIRADYYSLNACVNAMTPYSCGDGTCVTSPDECQTCSFYCESFSKCVASSADCTTLESGSSLEFLQICPDAAPYRCVTNGQCVNSALQCYQVRAYPLSQIYEMTFTGQLLDSTCPFSSPIRCVSGNCVTDYYECMVDIDLTSAALASPIAWGAPYATDVTETCQVYCSDGSCRDRQENCPQILGCTDPLKPFKCKVGFCAQSTDNCVELYGYAVEIESAGIPSATCQSEYGSSDQMFFRCEDGTCRPATQTSTGYTSSCLSYNGCGLEKPYQCPSGMCVETPDDCFNYNNELCLTDSTTPFQCKDFTCAASPQDCSRNPSLVTPLTLEYDLDVLESAVTIDFAFVDNFSVGRLVMPASPITTTTTSTTGKYRLRFDPVPSSVLNGIFNTLSTDYYPQLSPYFNMNSSTGQISNAESLITPQVNIYALGEVADLSFNTGTKMQFYVNDSSFSQTVMDVTNDFCLARADTSNQWKCTQRDFEQLEDGFWSFDITQSGIYAMIVSPNEVVPVPPGPVPPGPDPIPDDPGEEGSFYTSLMGLIIVGGGTLLLIIVILLLCWYFGCLCCCKRNQNKDPLQGLPPASINYDPNDHQSQERERLMQDRKDTGADRIETDGSRKRLRASQVALEKEQEVAEVKEKFEALIKVKSEEIEKLKDQLLGVKDEHDKRQHQIDEFAMSEKSRKTELDRFKSQLRSKYQAQVVKITKQAKQEIEHATTNLKASQVKNYMSAPTKNTETELDHYSAVQKRYAINDEVRMGSDDSFDSDQQREIALLDQQWNDLVTEYVGDPNLMICPPNVEERLIIQHKRHYNTFAPGELDISENLMSPSDNGRTKNPNSLYNSAMTQKGGMFSNRKPPNSGFSSSPRHDLGVGGGYVTQTTHRPDSRADRSAGIIQTETKSNRRGNINLSSHYEDNQSQNTSRYRPIVTQSDRQETDGDYQTAGTYRRRKRGRREMTTQLSEEEKVSRYQTEEEEVSPHPPHRLQIRNELIELANHFIDSWDEFADREFVSNQYGFKFVARQTEHMEQTMTVTKAFIPGVTFDHYHRYRERYNELTPQLDDKISLVSCPDYEGCKCVLQQIKMPMFMTNRSIPVLMYFKQSRDGSFLEQIGSSSGSEAVVQAQASKIKKNVIGNNVVNYIKLVLKPDGCEWTSVLCIDIAGDIPNALKRQGAQLQLESQEKLIYMIKNGKAP